MGHLLRSNLGLGGQNLALKGIGGGVLGQNGDLSDSYSLSAKFSDAFYGIEKARSVVDISRDEFSKAALILYILKILKISIVDVSQFIIFGSISVSGAHIQRGFQTLSGEFLRFRDFRLFSAPSRTTKTAKNGDFRLFGPHEWPKVSNPEKFGPQKTDLEPKIRVVFKSPIQNFKIPKMHRILPFFKNSSRDYSKTEKAFSIP